MTAGLSFAYSYDVLGRIKTVTESDAGPTVSVRCYTYDAAGRLAGVYAAADAAMATCTGSPIASYGYDANGNRVSAAGASRWRRPRRRRVPQMHPTALSE